MKSIIRLVIALLLLVGWSLAALSLHVVRTPAEIPITLITKDRFGVNDTYVDTTKWTLDDAAKHPELVQKLIRIGKADVLKHVTGGDKKSSDVAAQLSDALKHAHAGEASKSTQPTTIEQAAQGILGLFR